MNTFLRFINVFKTKIIASVLAILILSLLCIYANIIRENQKPQVIIRQQLTEETEKFYKELFNIR